MSLNSLEALLGMLSNMCEGSDSLIFIQRSHFTALDLKFLLGDSRMRKLSFLTQKVLVLSSSSKSY